MLFQPEQDTRRSSVEAYDLRLTFLFQPDVILPLQYLERFRSNTYLEGEKKLMLAVIEDAVSCFQKYSSARDKKGKQLFHEVEEWIMEEKDEWLFSFANICESLEIHPGYLRRGLVQWKDKQISAFKLRKGNGVKTMAKDPVCGMEIDEKRSSATSTYKGVTYFFCGKGCKIAFDKEPEKYLSPGKPRSHCC